MTHTFTTTIQDQEATITYTYHRAYAGSYYEPPEPASIEIQSVEPAMPEDVWEQIEALCFEDYADYMADAEDWKYEMRRDGW